MTRDESIQILMQAGSTKSEAENHLNHGTVIYDDPGEYIQMLKDNNIYDGDSLEDIRAGKDPDVSMVNVDGHEYLIMYSL